MYKTKIWKYTSPNISYIGREMFSIYLLFTNIKRKRYIFKGSHPIQERLLVDNLDRFLIKVL